MHCSPCVNEMLLAFEEADADGTTHSGIVVAKFPMHCSPCVNEMLIAFAEADADGTTHSGIVVANT